MKIHHIKLHTRYYDYVALGLKNAEVRYNDRDYKTGDWLVLQEWDGEIYTGQEVERMATSVFPLDEIGLKNWVLICLL